MAIDSKKTGSCLAQCCALLCFALIASGCATTHSATRGQDQTLTSTRLDLANRKAERSRRYFESSGYLSRLEAVQSEYQGSLDPRDAVYLEKDVYYIDSPDMEAYLIQVAQRLVSSGWNGPPIDYSIRIESRDDNCAATDELKIIRVCTGLLRNARSEAALAGVIAHELGHIMLRHSLKRRRAAATGWAITTAADLVLAVEAQYESTDWSSLERARKRSRDKARVEAFSVLWSEFLSPAWTRNQERAADEIAVDLLSKAGYQPLRYQSFVSTLPEVVLIEDNRWQVFRQLAHAKIDEAAARQRKADDTIGKTILLGLLTSLTHSMSDSFIDGIIQKRLNHDSPDQRSIQIASYFETHYLVEGKIQKPTQGIDDEFDRVLKRGRGSFVLEADMRASALIKAIQFGDHQTVRRLSSLLKNFPEIESAYAFAKAEAIGRRLGQYFDSNDEIVAALDNPETPSVLYLRVAEAYLDNNRPLKALEIVDMGIDRIGRTDRFLPTRIRALQKLDRIEDAEEEVRRCRKRDRAARSSSIVVFFRYEEDVLYGQCTQALGYDLYKKERQERKEKLRKLGITF